MDDAVAQRFDRIEQKVDALSTSVDRRFDEVDGRFGEVQQHFIELREYIEFAYDRLDGRMTQEFGRLDRKLDQLLDSKTRPPSSRRSGAAKRRR